MRKSEEKQKRLGWIRGLGNGLLAIVILCGLAMVVPGLFRIEMFNVVSGSMAPQIPVGSLIGVRYEAPETLQPGDVIAFLHRDSVVTHRVVANEKQNHELITTRRKTWSPWRIRISLAKFVSMFLCLALCLAGLVKWREKSF